MSSRRIASEKYRKLLRVAVKNEKRIRKARLSRGDLVPTTSTVPPQYQSVAVQRADTVKQRQIALTHLTKVMDSNEARDTLDRIQDPDHIWKINSNWEALQHSLKGRQNLHSTSASSHLNRFLTRVNI
jgi:hypothetical protein